MVWGMYGVAFALEQAGQYDLAARYRSYIAYLASTAQMVFYRGDGNVSWVTTINNVSAFPYPENYAGQSDPGDPYEVWDSMYTVIVGFLISLF